MVLQTAGANLPQGVCQTTSGATLLQQVTQGQLLNVLLNTQSNHTFLLTTDITLVLPGFEAFQASVLQQLGALRFADDIQSALAAGGH